jgi:RNase adaptor protein for sRNA GlmZ degradation
VKKTNTDKKVFIVTGMSGAGKSQALKCFEDLGFYCIDNLPTDLLPAFAKLLQDKKYLKNVALGMDIREGKYLKGFVSSLDNLVKLGIDCKYGIPLDADIVMDVRFLPNPNYIPRLKKKTGLDKGVQVYFQSKPMLKKFIERYSDQIKDLIPLYIKEGKSYLTIAIGCTGGRHRSVYISNQIARKMEKFGFSVSEHHRDIRKITQ